MSESRRPLPSGLLRSALAWAAAACVGSFGAWSVESVAGSQQYEPMSAAVRTALAASVRQETPGEAVWQDPVQKEDWLEAMARHLPARWKPVMEQRIEFLEAVRYEAQRAGLDPHLMLGLIEVESYFRRFAISHAGARGYMQVMPFWTQAIGDADPAMLFDMRSNLRYGAMILRHYLDMERGDLFLALGRYNGSRGRAEYPNMVLRAWRKWESRIPPQRTPEERDRILLARAESAAMARAELAMMRLGEADAVEGSGSARIDDEPDVQVAGVDVKLQGSIPPVAAGPSGPALNAQELKFLVGAFEGASRVNSLAAARSEPASYATLMQMPVPITATYTHRPADIGGIGTPANATVATWATDTLSRKELQALIAAFTSEPAAGADVAAAASSTLLAASGPDPVVAR